MDQLISDEEIVKSVQSGNTDAFATLLERYEAKINRYASKFLASSEDRQDVVQEVFLKAFVNIQSFDATRRFSPWLYRIAHNEFINTIKKRGREPVPFFDPDTIFPHPVANDSPEDDLYRTQIKEIMDKLLDKMDVKYREVLVLFYYEDLDYQTISDILQIPVSTVGVRLNRAKAKIIDLYKHSDSKKEEKSKTIV